MASFRDRLNELKDEYKRNKKGMTQAKMAQDLGITPQAFSYYLNGREPSYDLLVKISEYFSCSTDYLLGKSDLRSPALPKAVSDIGLTIQNIDFIQNGLRKWTDGRGYPYSDPRKPIDILNELLTCQSEMKGLFEAVKAATSANVYVPPYAWGDDETTIESINKAIAATIQNIESRKNESQQAIEAAKLMLEAAIQALTPEFNFEKIIGYEEKS